MITTKTLQKTQTTGPAIICLVLLIFCTAAEAAPSHRTTYRKCPFIGIKASRQYFSKNDYRCYQKASQFSNQGLRKGRIKNSRQSDISADGIPSSCRYITIPRISTYYEKNKLRCFGSEKFAKRAKYRPLSFPAATVITPSNPSATASLTPTPAITPVTSSTIPLQDKGIINYSFRLSPTIDGSGYTGNCLATLNNTHTQLEFTCTHNVERATEAHIHIVPDNSKFCEIENINLRITSKCELNAEQSAGIEAGLGLIAIHIGEGAQSQAAAAFIRNEL